MIDVLMGGIKLLVQHWRSRRQGPLPQPRWWQLWRRAEHSKQLAASEKARKARDKAVKRGLLVGEALLQARCAK